MKKQTRRVHMSTEPVRRGPHFIDILSLSEIFHLKVHLLHLSSSYPPQSGGAAGYKKLTLPASHHSSSSSSSSNDDHNSAPPQGRFAFGSPHQVAPDSQNIVADVRIARDLPAMASSPSPSEVSVTNHPHSTIKIAPDPDLTVRIYEYEDVYLAPGQLRPIKRVTDYAVSEAVLRANSDPFDKMLGGGWKESRTNFVELKEDDRFMNLAMEIWFRAFHGVPMTEECHNGEIAVVWSIIRAGDLWGLKREGLTKWFRDWFKQWWDKNGKGKDLGKSTKRSTGICGGTLAQMILYPCWAFDHAPGFAAATKWLVYNSKSHITEFNPTTHRDLHLPPRVIRKCIHLFLRTGCPC